MKLLLFEAGSVFLLYIYIYENSEPNSRWTYPVSITKKSLVILLRELIPLYCNIYVKRINTHSVSKMLSFLSLKKVANTNTGVL